MKTTPYPIIDSVVRSVCGREVERFVRLTSGGLNETCRAELRGGLSVIVRIARRPVPWFTQESLAVTQARKAGVPTPEVLGVEHLEHNDELLSFSVLEHLPGRPLDELVDKLSASDLARLVTNSGELLARVHSIDVDCGVRHELTPPEKSSVARAVRVAHQTLGPTAATAVERGAELLCHRVLHGSAPKVSLAHGDWLPKHFLIDDGAIVGIIDWEFAGPASPAFDIARWEVSAGTDLHDRLDLLHRGYARIAKLKRDDADWVPAFAIDWALEMLAWNNPASPDKIRRCIHVHFKKQYTQKTLQKTIHSKNTSKNNTFKTKKIACRYQKNAESGNRNCGTMLCHNTANRAQLFLARPSARKYNICTARKQKLHCARGSV